MPTRSSDASEPRVWHLTGGLEVDPQQRTVRRADGPPLPLSAAEAAVFLDLARAEGAVVERHSLHERCFRPDTPARSVDYTVRRLREKIEPDPHEPRFLVTVHGAGYRLALSSPAPPPTPPDELRVEVGERWVAIESGRVSTGGSLTLLEAEVLRILAAACGRPVGRERLLREVWRERGRSGPGSRRPDAVIRSLRVKLEPDPGRPRWILSTGGRGWRLETRRAARRTNLGELFEAVPLVGQQEALEGVLGALARHRWAAITGPAGIGKSRLAREVLRSAATLPEPRGAWWVPAGAGALWERIAGALGAAVEGDSVRLVVLDALAERAPALLAIDDPSAVEVDRIAEILAAVRELAVLVTCRDRTPLPRRVPCIRLDPLASEEARALFLAHAARVCPDAPIDPVALDRLLGRLDGLPLAIEVAASRIDVVDVPWLAERIDPLQPAPAGEGSLASALRSAWRALPPRLRRALSAATLLRAPFEPAALDAIAGVESDPDEATLAEALVHRSWLHPAETAVGRRVRLLDTTAAFVTDVCPPDVDAIAAHARWFAARARSLRERVRTVGGDRALAEVRHELEDLRAASLTASVDDTEAIAALFQLRPAVPYAVQIPLAEAWIERHPGSIALWLAAAWTRRWATRLDGADEALARALALGADPAGWPVRALRAALADDRDDPREGEQCLALLGPEPEDPIARADWLFRAARFVPDRTRRQAHIEELLRIGRRRGDAYACRLGTNLLAVDAWCECDWSSALPHAEQTVALERAAGAVELLPYSLHMLASIQLVLGSCDAVAEALGEAQHLADALEDDAAQLRIDHMRATLALLDDDLALSRRCAASALGLAERQQNQLDAWGLRIVLCLAALLEGDVPAARRELAACHPPGSGQQLVTAALLRLAASLGGGPEIAWTEPAPEAIRPWLAGTLRAVEAACARRPFEPEGVWPVLIGRIVERFSGAGTAPFRAARS